MTVQRTAKRGSLTTVGLVSAWMAFGAVAIARAGDETLIAPGAEWLYLDDGSDQASAWRDPAFDDAAWASGPAQLGYGDGDEATIVDFGPDSQDKYIATYFRHDFEFDGPGRPTSVLLRVLRDDGAVVYLNGVEVYRGNMPSGPIGYRTLALEALSGREESTFAETFIDVDLIEKGPNVIAVEIHQAAVTSSDISFDLELIVRAGDETLIAPGTTWRYLDDGSDQESAWRDPAFDDAAWAAGPAQLGYGDGDEATVVDFGPDSDNKFITTYFRHAFQFEGPQRPDMTLLRILRDDGAVVYLNGVEVYRSNMPDGPIGYRTLAIDALGGGAESAFTETFIDVDLIEKGRNVMAVEIHQARVTSSDISFDLELITGQDLLRVSRGPYLQLATSDGITIRWRTNAPTDSRVWYRTPDGGFVGALNDPEVTSEHEMRIEGLPPDTKYFYSVGSSTGVIAGGGEDFYFHTAPPIGTAAPLRIWAIGDSGTGGGEAVAVRDSYRRFAADRPTDLWLMLGDNAYESGTDDEYQVAVFDMYPDLLRRTTLWPTFGNHDGVSANSGNQSGPYYDSFTLPTAGEAGGVPSGTEAYYSFDYGRVHFVCLNSHDVSREPDGPMMTWVGEDLDGVDADWVIAYWHHAPYSKGSHDSDGDPRMRDMREKTLPILESLGVDLVLGGHSHSYERTHLLDGHYGRSQSLTRDMILDWGGGRPEEWGAYVKPPGGPVPHAGTVYVLAGTGGRVGRGRLNHPAMFKSSTALGSLVIDIEGNRLDVRFLEADDTIGDRFTIVKRPRVPDGDFDRDGDVDLLDFVSYPDCLTGPDQTTDRVCRPFDCDRDLDVDLHDFACFQAAFGRE